jgi:LytS/YehU family sensor histidine kinase
LPGKKHGWGKHRGEGEWDLRWMKWYVTNILTYVFIFGISFSYRIIKDAKRIEKIRKEKENETLKTELSFLRSQVSPHFMFNVLNTLVSLARKKSDLMEPSLIQLSNLMRYMLYESNDERISLTQEVEYLRSYIDLQMLRFGDDVTIELNIEQDLEEYSIEPMLLISFVENAFKHGVGMIDNPLIKVFLSVERTKHWLDFRVENGIQQQEGTKDKSSGIGLINVRRRLELLYKGRYTLETRQNGNIFVSNLKVQLK